MKKLLKAFSREGKMYRKICGINILIVRFFPNLIEYHFTNTSISSFVFAIQPTTWLHQLVNWTLCPLRFWNEEEHELHRFCDRHSWFSKSIFLVSTQTLVAKEARKSKWNSNTKINSSYRHSNERSKEKPAPKPLLTQSFSTATVSRPEATGEQVKRSKLAAKMTTFSSSKRTLERQMSMDKFLTKKPRVDATDSKSPKEPSDEPSEELIKETFEDPSEELSREPVKEPTEEPSKEIIVESPGELSKNLSRDRSLKSSRVGPVESTRATVKESSGPVLEESFKPSTKELLSLKESPKVPKATAGKHSGAIPKESLNAPTKEFTAKESRKESAGASAKTSSRASARASLSGSSKATAKTSSKTLPVTKGKPHPDKGKVADLVVKILMPHYQVNSLADHIDRSEVMLRIVSIPLSCLHWLR